MASQLSDTLDIVARLRESARRGDWESAAALATSLPRQAPPEGRDDVGEYLRLLKEALAVAKASRTHAAASLARLKAAATFNHARLDLASERQNIGDTADF
jgi:hypothetical protein